MATKQANSLTAPSVVDLVTDGSAHSPGIMLTWVVPASPQLYATEIWRHVVNNRAGAAKVAVVVGVNGYMDIVEPNKTYYYWIRGVNLYGKGTGAWFPTNSTDGITGIDLLPYYTSLANVSYNNVYTDNTWQIIEEFKIYNPTSRIIQGMAIFACSLESDTGADATLRVTVVNDPTLPSWTYPTTIGEVSKPAIAMPIYVPANVVIAPYTYRVEFHGSVTNGSRVARRGTLFNWEYVWY